MSMLGFIKRMSFWGHDILSGGGMYAAYREILSINARASEENKSKVDRQLHCLLRHAIATTKYYANYKPVLETFPVVNKQTVIDNRSSMFSAKYIGAKLHEMHTSGSTGIPFTLQQDLNKRIRVIAEIKAMNEQAKYKSHERMLYIAGGSQPRETSIAQQHRDNIYRIFVKINDDATMQKIVDFLITMKPVAIHASASNLPPLIEYIRLHKIPQSWFHVKTVITGGEMVPEKLCDDIRSVFGQNTVIGIKYSNEELGIMAQKTDGNYVLNHADYFVEILKIDSDDRCAPGEFGRIVVTDLYNFAVPIIRYDTGDCGALKYADGRWPELVNLSGKRRDLIFATNGSSISGAAITNTLKHSNHVRMWQLIQLSARKYEYRIVAESVRNPSNADICLGELYDLLGADADIEVKKVSDIPVVSSGKRRYTVNLYKPQ